MACTEITQWEGSHWSLGAMGVCFQSSQRWLHPALAFLKYLCVNRVKPPSLPSVFTLIISLARGSLDLHRHPGWPLPRPACLPRRWNSPAIGQQEGHGPMPRPSSATPSSFSLPVRRVAWFSSDSILGQVPGGLVKSQWGGAKVGRDVGLASCPGSGEWAT